MKDIGINLLINSLKNLKESKRYGTNGKTFEDRVKQEFESQKIIQGSLEPDSDLFLNNQLKLSKKDFNYCKENIKNLILDKKNLETIQNPFKNFVNNYIYIYISTFWLPTIPRFYFNYK
ncbi:MAG: hypothetical protein K2I76_01000 [Malacoplasma sp.]|nr:hypothetical protein [Malacoplasma sp.]